jgi:hypothetical protein
MTKPVMILAARKVYRCDWCGDVIPVFGIYWRYRCFMDGDSGTVRMHSECLTAMREEAASQDTGWLEWSPYSNQRGLAERSE